MTRNERYLFYEKLYNQEVDRREKISARLTLLLAVTAAVAGLLSFMLNSTEKPYGEFINFAFWTLFVMSLISLLAGAWFFRKAWFGHTDKLLPTAQSIENYHNKLLETYADYSNQEELASKYFSEFLFDYYVRFSSINAINNDTRTYNIYRTSVCLTISIFLALATAVPFYIGNTTSETSHMTDPKDPPPPPPPPPPERSVKGDTPKTPPPPPLEKR